MSNELLQPCPWTSPQPDVVLTFAQDALGYIKAEELVPEHGTYVGLECCVPEDQPEAELKTLVEENRGCRGCAIGSLFYAKLLKTNNFKAKEYWGSGAERFFRYLEPELGRFQLSVIEAAFEGIEFLRWLQASMEKKLILWINQIPKTYHLMSGKEYAAQRKLHAHRQLVRVLENIVRHNGVFLLPGFVGYIPDQYDLQPDSSQEKGAELTL